MNDGPKSTSGKRAIVEAAKRIQFLERELQKSTVTIHKLQQQNMEHKISELQQSKLDATRALARTKAERDAMEIRFKVASEECATKDRKYQELLSKFGEFQHFKKRELDTILNQKDNEIEQLKKQLQAVAGGTKRGTP